MPEDCAQISNLNSNCGQPEFRQACRNVSSTHLQAPLGHGMDRDASISRVGLPLPEIRPENQELAGGLMLRQLRTTCSLLSRIFDVLVCLK